MNEVARLIEAFGSRGKRDQSAWKLDVLMDLGRLDDPRVSPFLMTIVVDPDEPTDVRLDALGRLREATLAPDDRAAAARACLEALSPAADSRLRLRTALVLGDFVDVRGVLEALSALTRDVDESIELRYNAFTSLQRSGPTCECLTILRALCADEVLGQSARALLTSWGVP